MIGNKVDLDRQVDTKKTTEFAHRNRFDYLMEASASTGKHVENLFQDIAERLVEKDKQGRIFVFNPRDIIRPAKGDGKVKNYLHTVWHVKRPQEKLQETQVEQKSWPQVPSFIFTLASKVAHCLGKPPFKEYKVTFVGDSGVGKTCLIKKFVEVRVVKQ